MQENRSSVNFSGGRLARCRWNVLDLITIVAKNTKPAYLFCDIDMTQAELLRKRLASRGPKITVTAILLKAVALAQQAHPMSRSIRLPWGNRVTLERPVAGFTVERMVGDQPAVFFGVIDDPVNSSLANIAENLREHSQSDLSDLTQLNRQNVFSKVPWLFRQIGLWFALRVPAIRKKVNPATFGLSTLGKFGLSSLLGPCVSTCIFGVGSVAEKVVAIDSRVEVREMMTLTLSVDTSVMSIHQAERFMADVKAIVESEIPGKTDEDLLRQQAALSYATS